MSSKRDYYGSSRGPEPGSYRGGGGPGRGHGRGGGGPGRGHGRGGRGGGRGRGPDLSDIKKVKTNMVLAHPDAGFEFYMYTTDTRQAGGMAMDSRHRRSYLFYEAIFKTLLKDMPKEQISNMKDITFFEGSFFFSAKPIPGLEPELLPRTILTGDTTGGETFTVKKSFHFTAPQCFKGFSRASLEDELAFECKCQQCPKKVFGSVQSLLQHCADSGHEPDYVEAPGQDALVADEPTFLQYANIVLRRSLSNTLAPWGKDYVDPTCFEEREGVLVYRAYSCEFNYMRTKTTPKAYLGLTVDLRAKVMRNKSLLDEICEGRDPNTMRFSARDEQYLNDKWTGEVVIYKLDKKCYPVVALRFDHSAESLPVDGLHMSHAQYFEVRKKSPLQYPRARPMVEVQGRRNESIFLPAELVSGNELDPRVREKLPLIASHIPERRTEAVNVTIKKLADDGLLKRCRISLENESLKPVPVIVMPVPVLIAAGVKVPTHHLENWGSGVNKAWFTADSPREGVRFKVIVFYSNAMNEHIALNVYKQIRNFAEGFHARFSLEDTPLDMVEFHGGDDPRNQTDKVLDCLKKGLPENTFILNFIRPRGKTDPAYPIVKHLLGRGGYLSQFVSFKTFDHGSNIGNKRSNMILQGVARQILQKSGARLWWVSLPKELPLPTVFVGVDIFHAPRQYDRTSKQRVRKPSCAAIVVQAIRDESEETKRQVEVYSETYMLPGGQEAGLQDPLRRTIKNALEALNLKNPRSCIVWRDGIAESSFGSMAKEEIEGIEQGFEGGGDVKVEAILDGILSDHAVVKKVAKVVVKEEENRVPMAYVVCQKRIATKLLTTGTSAAGENLEGLYGAQAGTCVDAIQGLNKYDTFYIQGRAPPYSTPKPVRYITIKQDKELSALNMHKLTWDMCHDYPNWTGSIKVPSPCMNAHKLAMFAGMMPSYGGEEIDHHKYVNKLHFL